MNGDVTENGHGDSAPEPKKCDIIVITGKKENCEQAKAALLVSVHFNGSFEYGRNSIC